MKTLFSIFAVFIAVAAFAANEDAKPRITLTLANGKSMDYKLDWIDENKIVVFEHGTLAAVTYKRKEVASISFGEDKSGRFRAGEEGFVLNDGSLLLGHPTSMDIDTYWIVPRGSRKEEKIERGKVVFIQLEKPAAGGPGDGSGEAQGVEKSLTLVVATQWEDTGVDVVEGQKIWFTVSGQEMFSCGADAPRVNADGKDPLVRDPRRPLPDVKHCALIAKIGKGGAPFRVGLNQTPFSADGKGRIYVEVNDFDFNDNLGKVGVYIKTGDM